MDKETYEALKRLIDDLREVKEPVRPTEYNQYEKDMRQINSWIDEVAKEYWECKNKDENGNACWDCEMGEIKSCGESREK